MNATTIWHDVECGAYSADLALWEEMAGEAGGPVLELGCGTGRVALHLARRGYPVVGVDLDPELVAALSERAGGLPVQAIAADARDFSSRPMFPLPWPRCRCCSCFPTPPSGPPA
jgi:predicted RNA methylase